MQGRSLPTRTSNAFFRALKKPFEAQRQKQKTISGMSELRLRVEFEARAGSQQLYLRQWYVLRTGFWAVDIASCNPVTKSDSSCSVWVRRQKLLVLKRSVAADPHLAVSWPRAVFFSGTSRIQRQRL